MLRLLNLAFALCLSAATAFAQNSVPADSRLKSITGKKVIRVAYRADASPFSFISSGEPVGYTIDLCVLVTKSLADQFGLGELKIEWVPVTVDTRFAAVAAGKADMECGSSTTTLGRMKEVDFSNLTFVESTGVLVTRASNTHAFADMAGKKIAVVAGTSNARAVTLQVRAQKLEVTLIEVKDRDAGSAALEAGTVDGFASDKLLLAGAQLKRPEALVLLPDDLSIEPYAIVLPRGDWALRLAVNTALAHIYTGPAIDAIYGRWFGRAGLRPGPLLQAVYALGGLAD